jgi:hypothetical protein
MSEFLRVQQGKGEVAEKEDGKNEGNTGDDIDLHGLPQLLAGHDVEERHGEKDNGEQQHGYILHRRSPAAFESAAQV